jgi:hypothetical protein
MSKATRTAIDYDADDNEVVDLKSQRRPLQKGETVPHIPTMLEQMDSAWAAANHGRAKPR